MAQRRNNGLTNADLAELLAREVSEREGILVRAFRRAARSAFLWPERATDLVGQGRALTELHSVGPFIAKQLTTWIESPPKMAGTLPPDRRDFITLADARNILSRNPSWATKLRGDLQMHTHWSDGSGAIGDMAAAAVERNYEYVAITDHSKGLKIAGGIDEAQLAKQGREIGRLNKGAKSGVTVLRSIEMNLNPRGEGDMDPQALAALDIVLGSFHSALRTKEDQTARYLAAVRNPDIQTLGHPRGRIYNYRLGLKADWARVFAEAAKLGKAVEIDCYPDRQDLNPALLRIAKREGVRLSLGTDAHHPWQLEFIELGLATALQARIPAERIINFMPLPELRQWVAKVREKAKRRR